MAVDRSRRARAVRRRKRRMDGVEHDLSDEQWVALKLAWGGCAYCGATGWLRRKRLDESAFLVRHLEIQADLAARFPPGPPSTVSQSPP